MTNQDHPANDLLILSIDDELPESQASLVAAHLSNCADCSRRYREFLDLSKRLEALQLETMPPASYGERESLNRKLQPREVSNRQSFDRILRRFGWGVGIAAALAIAITLAPRTKTLPTPAAARSTAQDSTNFEVNGETFVSLPYSNPDLPLAGPHILQMRVPAYELASAGISLGPTESVAAGSDGSVLADVLLGADGQPLGVHVVEFE